VGRLTINEFLPTFVLGIGRLEPSISYTPPHASLKVENIMIYSLSLGGTASGYAKEVQSKIT
jgi:hypothetical protein